MISTRVAAAQVSPVYLDRDRTLAKVADAIAEAARGGAALVVFPETLVPGYPSWRGVRPISRWSEIMLRYQEQSLEVGSPTFATLQDAVKRAGLWVALGASELVRTRGACTLYNTLFFFDAAGELVLRHRKLVPTHAERTVWGMGDGRDLAAVDAPFARLGGLICYEHLVPAFKAAMVEVGEEIHCALWSGYWVNEPHQGSKRRWRAGDAIEQEASFTSRSYAVETQTFVVAVGNHVRPEDLPDEARDFDLGAGGSAIYGPGGTVLAGPVFDEEKILYADCSEELRRATKAYIDCAGHYSRPDVVRVTVDRRET
jgi:predicted amidohydrolase